MHLTKKIVLLQRINQYILNKLNSIARSYKSNSKKNKAYTQLKIDSVNKFTEFKNQTYNGHNETGLNKELLQYNSLVTEIDKRISNFTQLTQSVAIVYAQVKLLVDVLDKAAELAVDEQETPREYKNEQSVLNRTAEMSIFKLKIDALETQVHNLTIRKNANPSEQTKDDLQKTIKVASSLVHSLKEDCLQKYIHGTGTDEADKLILTTEISKFVTPCITPGNDEYNIISKPRGDWSFLSLLNWIASGFLGQKNRNFHFFQTTTEKVVGEIKLVADELVGSNTMLHN